MKIRHWILLLLFVSFNGLPGRASESAQNSVRELSEAEKTEYQLLSGKWLVRSAGYQMGGVTTYTFDNGALIVVSRSFPAAKDGSNVPFWETIEQYHCRLNINRVPKQIVLMPMDGKAGKEQKRIYEFRDGMLWVCPDDDLKPKDRTSLKNDRFGDGRLEGLEPIKQR